MRGAVPHRDGDELGAFIETAGERAQGGTAQINCDAESCETAVHGCHPRSTMLTDPCGSELVHAAEGPKLAPEIVMVLPPVYGTCDGVIEWMMGAEYFHLRPWTIS